MNIEADIEAKRSLFERRLQATQPTCTVTHAWIAERSPYRYAVWIEQLKPLHTLFDARDIVALNNAFDDDWFAAFGHKLSEQLGG